jgi:transcriptional regulator with XRE-family HTH domain
MNIEFKRRAVDVSDDDANGMAIRNLRKQSEMPQVELAKALSISPPYLSDLERGNRGFSEELFRQAVTAINQYSNHKNHEPSPNTTTPVNHP